MSATDSFSSSYSLCRFLAGIIISISSTLYFGYDLCKEVASCSPVLSFRVF